VNCMRARSLSSQPSVRQLHDSPMFLDGTVQSRCTGPLRRSRNNIDARPSLSTVNRVTFATRRMSRLTTPSVKTCREDATYVIAHLSTDVTTTDSSAQLAIQYVRSGRSVDHTRIPPTHAATKQSLSGLRLPTETHHVTT